MVVNYQGASKKARDSRRAADLEQLRSALEMHYTDKNEYPASLSGLSGNLALQGPKGSGDNYGYSRPNNHSYTICAQGWEGSPIPQANQGFCGSGIYGVTNP